MCTGGASSLCHVFVYSLPRHTISNLDIVAEPQPHSTVLECTQNGFFSSLFSLLFFFLFPSAYDRRERLCT